MKKEIYSECSMKKTFKKAGSSWTKERAEVISISQNSSGNSEEIATVMNCMPLGNCLIVNQRQLFLEELYSCWYNFLK
jgi:hypothetical protein